MQTTKVETYPGSHAENRCADNDLVGVKVAKPEGKLLDALLLDMQIPLMDAHEAVYQFRSLAFKGSIIVLIARIDE